MAFQEAPRAHRDPSGASQTTYHFHYTGMPSSPDYRQHQAAQQIYDAVSQALNNAAPSAAKIAPAEATVKSKKTQTKYYKPTSTQTSILSLFFISTLAFIAGIEFVLRRSVPISRINTLGSIGTLGLNATLASAGALASSSILESTSTLGSISSNASPTDDPFTFGSGPSKFVGADFSRMSNNPTFMKCIGVERIISVSDTAVCESAADKPVSCYKTATQQTYEAPIFNLAVPTMPCYVCALQKEGISHGSWITATTTRFATAEQTEPAIIQPCSSCEAITLTATIPWATSVTDYARLYTTYTNARHEHVHAGSATTREL